MLLGNVSFVDFLSDASFVDYLISIGFSAMVEGAFTQMQLSYVSFLSSKFDDYHMFMFSFQNYTQVSCDPMDSWKGKRFPSRGEGAPTLRVDVGQCVVAMMNVDKRSIMQCFPGHPGYNQRVQAQLVQWDSEEGERESRNRRRWELEEGGWDSEEDSGRGRKKGRSS